MRILLTGAAGFVGAHLARGIAGHFPDATLLATDLEGAPNRLDVRDRAAVRAAIAGFAPDIVIHAAAVTPTAAQELAEPARIAAVNVGAAFTLLDIATGAGGVRKVIALSSAAVFGTAHYAAAIPESGTPDPRSLYGTTKLAVENIAARLAAQRGVPVIAVRLAGVYGDLERSSSSRPTPSHVHRLSRALTASGPDVARDWVHADDVAAGIAGLIEVPVLEHGLYHVGGGEPVGWHRLIAAFRAAGHPIAWTDDGPADVAMARADGRPVLSIARIAAASGFRPRAIEQGVADLVRAGRSR